MSTKALVAMNADDLYKRWQGLIQHIYKETIFIFTTRYRFREVYKLFEKNEKLQKVGNDVYRWLFGMWGRDALMAIRRELDTQGNTINLWHLMIEIENRPDVLTRRRYVAFLQPDAPEFRVRLLNRGFDDRGALSLLAGSRDPLDDIIAPERVLADRKYLQARTKKTFDYAQRLVAHRTPFSDDLKVTMTDINDAMDGIEEVFKKYYLILSGNTLFSAEATIQYDWMAAFNIPWLPLKSRDDRT
jgi:hypothetical protein